VLQAKMKKTLRDANTARWL